MYDYLLILLIVIFGVYFFRKAYLLTMRLEENNWFDKKSEQAAIDNVFNRLYKKLRNFKSKIFGVGYKHIPEEEIIVYEYNDNIDSFIENSQDLLKSIYNENINDRGLTQIETENIIKSKDLVLRVVTELHKQKDVSYKEVDINTFKEQAKHSKLAFYYFSTKSGKIIAISNADIISFQMSCGVTEKAALAF